MKLRVGDFAKLLFVPDRGAGSERMWVRVTSVNASQCVGKLDNNPLFLTGIRAGSVVIFKPSQVLAVIEKRQLAAVRRKR